MASVEHCSSDLQNLLRQEFATVREKLDQLSCSQAALTSIVENKFKSLHVNSEPDKNTAFFEFQDVEDMAAEMARSQASFRNPAAIKKEEGIEASGKLYDILPSQINPEPDKVVDDTGLQKDTKDVSKDFLERSETEQASRKTQNRTSYLEQEGACEFSRLYNMYKSETKKADEQALRRQDSSYMERLKETSKMKYVVLDQVVSVVVLLNALFIGISADLWNGELNVFYVIDVIFCIIFFIELIVKLKMYGASSLYCGNQKFSNIFDLVLVTCDAVQLIIVSCMREAFDAMRDQGVPSVSLFRIVRVLRVARLLRIIRHRVFEELLAMLEAVVSGVRTLVWAIVLYILVVYVVALLCRDVLGHDPQYVEIYEYFNSVPRSVFTVYRCSFGDCSSASGTPIPEAVHTDFGTAYSVFFCLLYFFIAIGLFNVISAIFVDRTMIHAARVEAKRTKEQLMDEQLWASRVSIFVIRCLESMGKENLLEDLGNGSLIPNIAIPSSVVADVCQRDPQAISALLDLGIDEYDHRNLAVILDYNQSGSITLHQFVNGLQHMRGLPRRSDVVANCLMLQSLHAKIADVHRLVFRKKTSSSKPTSQRSVLSCSHPGRAWE